MPRPARYLIAHAPTLLHPLRRRSSLARLVIPTCTSRIPCNTVASRLRFSRSMHPEISEEYVKALALGFALMAATLGFAPVARADMNLGNYEVQWSRPWDFHTWVLQITQCVPPSGAGALPGCVKVSANPRPIARAAVARGCAPRKWPVRIHRRRPRGSALRRLLRPLRSHPRYLLMG